MGPRLENARLFLLVNHRLPVAMTAVGGPSQAQDTTLSSLLLSTDPPLSLVPPTDAADPLSASHAYLLSLTSQSLLDLRAQPAALSTAQSSLNTQLSSLCSQHVSSFVQVHRATSSLPASLESLDSVLQSLIERDLPALSDAAQLFTRQVQGPLQAKEKAQNLISQYELSLKDLLDIPRLLMTCVRANHPVEALLLAAHMRRVGIQGKHSHLVTSLLQECWTHLKRLREDLLRGLGARGLRLPAARRYLSLLRKFKEVDDAKNGVDERSLEKLNLSDSTICLSFLRSRWTLIEELGGSENEGNSLSALSSRLSTWRDLVGDSCGMAQALFSDTNQGAQGELPPSTLISRFAHQALAKLRGLITDSLPRLEADYSSLQDDFEALAAIHTQLAYSAASLSRQGLDISRTVEGDDAFHQRVEVLWKNAMHSANTGYQKSREGKVVINCLDWVGQADVKELLNGPLSSYSSDDGWSSRARQFPDLIILFNGLLTAYNGLLSFAPRTSGPALLAEMDVTLSQVVQPLLSAVQSNELDDYNLSLPTIVSSSSQSLYFEKDAARQSQANSAVFARILSVLGGPMVRHIRGLVIELFELDETATKSPLALALGEAQEWAQGAERAWEQGEARRREQVREEEENLVAEEKKQKEAEQARQVELERRRVEEAARRREDEIEKEELLKSKRAEEAEAAKRLATAESQRKIEEAHQKDQEESQRLREQEESSSKEQKLMMEQAQRKRQEEAEQLKQSLDEENLQGDAENDAQQKDEAQTWEKEGVQEARQSLEVEGSTQEAHAEDKSEERSTLIPDGLEPEEARRDKMEATSSTIAVEGRAGGRESQIASGEGKETGTETTASTTIEEFAGVRADEDNENDQGDAERGETQAETEEHKEQEQGQEQEEAGENGKEEGAEELTAEEEAPTGVSRPTNKLAEKLRLRQEERERAAKAGLGD